MAGVSIDLFVATQMWLVRQYGNRLVTQAWLNETIQALAEIERSYRDMELVPESSEETPP